MLELQGALKINKNLKKKVNELQRVCVGLREENEQLNGSKGWARGFACSESGRFLQAGLCRSSFLVGRLTLSLLGKTSRPSLFLQKTCLPLLLRLPFGEVVVEVSAQVGAAGG